MAGKNQFSCGGGIKGGGNPTTLRMIDLARVNIRSVTELGAETPR